MPYVTQDTPNDSTPPTQVLDFYNSATVQNWLNFSPKDSLSEQLSQEILTLLFDFGLTYLEV